tara:strand:- start:910 stop:1026 length:117 start_codon:yes stop_codon:yes gene_type:complete
LVVAVVVGILVALAELAVVVQAGLEPLVVFLLLQLDLQ